MKNNKKVEEILELVALIASIILFIVLWIARPAHATEALIGYNPMQVNQPIPQKVETRVEPSLDLQSPVCKPVRLTYNNSAERSA